MSSVLEQLELNSTFFVQMAIFWALFFVLARIYFLPFLKLFQARHKRTVADREAAGRVVIEAQGKLDEYRARLAQERRLIQEEHKKVLDEARLEEADVLARAREEAKKITQQAHDSVTQQRAELWQKIATEIDVLAQSVFEKILSRKA